MAGTAGSGLVAAGNSSSSGSNAGQGVAFATLRPKFSDCSAQLVELMRATLRQAQEIGAAVGEAECSAESARAVVAATEAATTEHEMRIAEMEIKRLQSGVLGARKVVGMVDEAGDQAEKEKDKEKEKVGISSAQFAPFASPSLVARGSAGAGRLQNSDEALLEGRRDAIGGTTKPISAQMAQEIETTVMWVQQLLESVHFIESDNALEPGASLLSIVQPRLRHQKDDALHQSLLLFHEKKESEKDVDELAAFFRRQALQAVSHSARSTPLGQAGTHSARSSPQ